MKTLTELMALLSKNDAKFYCAEISKWDVAKKNKLTDLSNRLLATGVKNPIPWAFSEVNENIPQFGRYLMLKNLFAIIKDPNGVIVDAAEFDEDIYNKVDVVNEVLGEDFLNKMLHAYGKAIISGVISIIDEGNCGANNDGVSWYLSETNGKGVPTGRIIQGLHEDFYDFED